MSKVKDTNEKERAQHIQEMKDQLKRLTGGFEPLYFSSVKNSKQEEKFLERILFMEGVVEQPLFDLLEKGGVQMPPPESLDDAALNAKLWEVIKGMARLGHYLSRTDHLSDRKLYEMLWKEVLREPTSVSPEDPGVSCHIDILGGCSQEDLQLNLKYYADEDERVSWAEQHPEHILPPHESLPYDRDRHLPAAPFD